MVVRNFQKVQNFINFFQHWTISYSINIQPISGAKRNLKPMNENRDQLKAWNATNENRDQINARNKWTMWWNIMLFNWLGNIQKSNGSCYQILQNSSFRVTDATYTQQANFLGQCAGPRPLFWISSLYFSRNFPHSWYAYHPVDPQSFFDDSP